MLEVIHRSLIAQGINLWLEALATGENLADLAHRHASFDPTEDATDFVDISLGIQAVPTFGARGLNQSISALPGT
ncbi:hypothetical protein D3C72_2468370 [compost metagenome]